MIFARKDSLTLGDYLSADYSWPYAITLQSMQVTCSPPTGGAAVAIVLEIGGALTESGITLQATGNTEDILSADLGIVVPANTAIRFKVVGAPIDPALSASKISITVPHSVTGAIAVQPLTVCYFNGPQVVPLYSYDPATHIFTDVSGGQAASLAYIEITPTFQDFGIFFQTTDGPNKVFSVFSGTLNTVRFIALGGSYLPTSPQIQFLRAGQILATLTADGILVAPSLISGTPTDSLNQFTLYSDGTITVAITQTGIVTTGYGELS